MNEAVQVRPVRKVADTFLESRMTFWQEFI